MPTDVLLSERPTAQTKMVSQEPPLMLCQRPTANRGKAATGAGAGAGAAAGGNTKKTGGSSTTGLPSNEVQISHETRDSSVALPGTIIDVATRSASAPRASKPKKAAFYGPSAYGSEHYLTNGVQVLREANKRIATAKSKRRERARSSYVYRNRKAVTELQQTVQARLESERQ
ncbi:hypothetical protein KIPB_011391 [Kipferlia bialata]|uniref:Uncharacterized protein n=1 Tax=Kipferlia bialata TaxID=797122 RepID=A0A9K3D6G1_9EUKA|nr:hypothetical protein KIPB_011391 [Kipferlia bialata]|eukprot:g11391.t1